MATPQEIIAADRLATALDLSSIALGGLCFKKVSELPTVSSMALSTIFHSGITASLGKLWKPEREFLQKSLLLPKDEPVSVAPLAWQNVKYEQDRIIQKILTTQKAEHAREIGVAVTRAITEQVDETQEVIGKSKGFSFTRHLDSGACDWCQGEVTIYEDTREWHRHSNCRCFKVRRD